MIVNPGRKEDEAGVAHAVQFCRDFRDGDVPIGRLAEPSVARSLRQVRFEPDELTLGLYRGFLETALVNLRALERILEEPWAFVFMLNGKFLAEWKYTKAERIDPNYEMFFNSWTMKKWIKGPPKKDAHYKIDWVKFYPHKHSK